VWQPHPGPQTLLVACPYEDILCGGARGGGKTQGMLGRWLRLQAVYGSNFRGVWFRRSMPEIEGAQVEMAKLFIPLGATYSVQMRTWTFPSGAELKLRYLESDADAYRYVGHEYCVAVGTPVLLADGSWAPIETVRVGDAVATLEGPRCVTATTAPYRAPCVRATVRDAAGNVVGEQVHPVWHPVLTPAGCFPMGAVDREPLHTTSQWNASPSEPTPQALRRPVRNSSDQIGRAHV